MNKRLEKQLDKYFYGDYCEEVEESEKQEKRGQSITSI